MSKIVNYAINIESGRPDDIAATFDLARHALAALAYGTPGYFWPGTLLTRPTLFASHVLHGPVRSEWPNLWFNTMGAIAEAVNGTVSVIRIDGSEDEVKFYSRELLSKMEKAEAQANARLVAAAPDLLEALEEMLAVAPSRAPAAGVIVGIEARHANAISKARAAIAKAKERM